MRSFARPSSSLADLAAAGVLTRTRRTHALDELDLIPVNPPFSGSNMVKLMGTGKNKMCHQDRVKMVVNRVHTIAFAIVFVDGFTPK